MLDAWLAKEALRFILVDTHCAVIQAVSVSSAVMRRPHNALRASLTVVRNVQTRGPARTVKGEPLRDHYPVRLSLLGVLGSAGGADPRTATAK